MGLARGTYLAFAIGCCPFSNICLVQDPKAVRKAKRDARKAKAAARAAKTRLGNTPVAPAPAAAPSTAEPKAATTSAAVSGEGQLTQRNLAAQVEEVEDSD